MIDAFARAADDGTHIYLVGGSTAVLEGWRESTVDVDFVVRPERDELLRRLPEIKERLAVNLELASPLDFIPVPAGWEDRSPLVRRVGRTSFHHFDPYAQVLQSSSAHTITIWQMRGRWSAVEWWTSSVYGRFTLWSNRNCIDSRRSILRRAQARLRDFSMT